MAQTFNSKQKHYIQQGITAQEILRANLDDAFFSNTFEETFIISSLPGLGKTHEMTQRKGKADVLVVEGTSSIAFFTIQIATAVYMAGGKPITIVLDDCDVLFEDKNTNIAKKMFDDTKALKYNKMRKGLKAICNDIQWEAIEHWASHDDMNPGFSVPLNNVTFIILSNRMLPSANYVDQLEDGSKKHSTATDLFAIRRRTQYEEISMDKMDLWGYVANVTLNESICEKFYPTITEEEKLQIVNWLYSHWDNVTERNLSIVEKQTKFMVRFPDRYLDVWENKLVQTNA